MSPTMQQIYKNLGDAVSFDITYKVCNVFVMLPKKKKKG